MICGAGRVGRSVADALHPLGLPLVIVESNDRRVQQARRAGLPVIYGDASQPLVLEAAGLARARAILVTASAFSDVRAIVAGARVIRPDIPIIARADSTDAVRALYGLGIQEVTSPEFEAAIEMTRQALMHFNVPAHDVLSMASAIRHERYGQHGESPLAMMSQIGEIARQLDFTWMTVPAGSPLDGQTLASHAVARDQRRVGGGHHPPRPADRQPGRRRPPGARRSRRRARHPRSDRALRSAAQGGGNGRRGHRVPGLRADYFCGVARYCASGTGSSHFTSPS